MPSVPCIWRSALLSEQLTSMCLAARAFLGEAWAVLGELTLPRLDYVARLTGVVLLVAILLLAFINLIDTLGVATVQAILHKPA